MKNTKFFAGLLLGAALFISGLPLFGGGVVSGNGEARFPAACVASYGGAETAGTSADAFSGNGAGGWLWIVLVSVGIGFVAGVGIARFFCGDSYSVTSRANTRALCRCMRAMSWRRSAPDTFRAVLKCICGRLRGARAVIFRFDTRGNSPKDVCGYFPRAFARRLGGGVSGKRAGAKLLSAENFDAKKLAETFLVNDAVLIADASDYMETSRFGLAMSDLGKSLYVARIELDGKLWGGLCVEFDFPKDGFTKSARDFFAQCKLMAEIAVLKVRMQTQLEVAESRVSDVRKQKRALASGFSDGIRRHVTPLLNAVKLLRRDCLNPISVRECIGGIAANGNALRKLANDIIDLSMLEAGSMRVLLERADFFAIAESVAAGFKGAKDRIEIDRKNLPPLELDVSAVGRILSILVSRALSRGADARARIWAEYGGTPDCAFSFGVALTACSDAGLNGHMADGRGEVPEDPSSAGSRVHNGVFSGLDLSIAKMLAESLGGRFEFSGAHNGAGSFAITLPNAVPLDDDILVDGQPPSVGVRILIVAASDVDGRVLRATCLGAGFENTDTACGCADAAEKLSGAGYDVVLMPVALRNGSRGDLERMRSKSDRVAFVAVAGSGDSLEGFPEGFFDGVLTKPATPSTLKRAVENALSASGERVKAS